MALAPVHLYMAPKPTRPLLEAPQIICEGGTIASFVHVLPAGARLELFSGEPELAAEFYALALRYTFVSNSRWYEDGGNKFIAAAATSLPPEVVTAVHAGIARAICGRRQRNYWKSLSTWAGTNENVAGSIPLLS
jgi:hypothetical protein